MTTESEIFEEALEFGLSIEAAQLVAPLMAQLQTDPRGPRQAIIEDDPRLAERLGWIRRQ